MPRFIRSCVFPIAFGLLIAATASVRAQTTVTYDRVLEWLELEVKEEKLLRLLQEQPTVFTLTEGQIARLRAAGASDKLLAAMQAKSSAAIESDISAYVMILDASGSMLEKASDGQSKWEVAKKSASELIAAVPEGLAFSVVIYGHDRQKACGVEVLRPLAPISENDKTALAQRIARIQPVGKTPITKSLTVAGDQLKSASGLAKILLITDGIETCQGDPVTAARQFADARAGSSVDVIGFALSDDDSAAVRKIAAGGKGEYYEAKSSAELAIAFDKATKELRELSKTDGLVKLAASKEMSEPTNLPFGSYTKARLAMKDSHYWSIDFPAGRHVLVFDAGSSDRRGAVLGQAELGVAEGGAFVSQASALISQNEIRGRGVIEISLDEPASRLVKVTNIFTDIMDYQLGAFGSEDDFGVPFLVNCPEVTPTTLGKAATSPAIGTAAEFNLDRDAFFHMTIPAGDNELEVVWSGGGKEEWATLRSVNLCDRRGVYTTTLLSSTTEKSARMTIQAADNQEVILRVRGAAQGERISVKLSPIEERE